MSSEHDAAGGQQLVQHLASLLPCLLCCATPTPSRSPCAHKVHELKLSSSNNSLVSRRKVRTPWAVTARRSPTAPVRCLAAVGDDLVVGILVKTAQRAPATLTPCSRQRIVAATNPRAAPAKMRMFDVAHLRAREVQARLVFPQILTMGSYPSRSGTLSPLRVLK